MNHLPDERLSQFGRAGTEPTAEESAHLAECPPCKVLFNESRAMVGLFGAFLAPSAAFARATVAAFEAAWQKKRARDVFRALAGAAALSLCSIAALVWLLPITALNTAGRALAEVAQKVRLVTHVVNTVTAHLSVPLLVALVIACLSVTLLIERSVRLGRRPT